MASYPQRKLMTDILNLPGFTVKKYRFIEELGIVRDLENQHPTVTCPDCGSLIIERLKVLLKELIISLS
jgi:hypothetical protein